MYLEQNNDTQHGQKYIDICKENVVRHVHVLLAMQQMMKKSFSSQICQIISFICIVKGNHSDRDIFCSRRLSEFSLPLLDNDQLPPRDTSEHESNTIFGI